MNARSDKWDRRFLDLAALIATWSKDPSTKCGAVIVAPDLTIISLGFNGLPRDIADTAERLETREMKYKIVLHAEENALLFARRDLAGCTIYTHPFMSCSACAAKVVQVGLLRAVAPAIPPELEERWGESVRLTKELFAEAGVRVKEIEL